MGCCGKRSKSLSADMVHKGRAVKELTIRPRALKTPSHPPGPPPATRSGGSSMTVEDSKVCKVCGVRLQAKRVWSDRLRRYYPVSWCPNCSKEA